MEKQAKQRSNSAYSFAMQDGKMVWTYPNIGVLTFDPNKASATNRARAMMHGFKQRINDSAAVDADKATGKTDPNEKFGEMQRMIAHLESGTEDWNMKPSAGVGAASYVTKALVAIGTYQGVDVSDTEKANAFVKKVSLIEKLGLKGEMAKARTWLEAGSKVIQAKIAEIRAAEAAALAAAANVDADEMMAELFAPEEDDGAAVLETANYEEMYRQGLVTREEAENHAVDTAKIDEEQGEQA